MPVALDRYAFVLHLLYAVASQGTVFLEFSENPVYNSSRLTLLCRFATNVTLTNVTVDAFNGTGWVGSLQCSVPANNSYGTGLFSTKKLNGCPTYVANSGNVNISMEASPNLELDYNCSVRVNDGNNFYNWTSDSARLQVRVLPSAAKLVPERLHFNESDRVAMECHSSHGIPSAHLKLTVSNKYRVLNTSEGNGLVSLNVSVPWTWHNATASCNVTNHPIVTENRSIIVNHIVIDHSEPLVVYTDSGDNVLNCSAAIAVFPEATFMWSIPDGLILNDSSLRSNPFFYVKQGQSGTFNCSATNIVTSKTVLVEFNVTNSTLFNVINTTPFNVTNATPFKVTNTSAKPQIPLYTYDFIIWALPIMGFVILILIVILCVLYKLGYFQKGCRLNKTSRMSRPSQQLNNSGCGQGGEVAMTENLIYDALVSQPSDDAQNAKHSGSSFSSYEGRLLVASEGAVANLKHKILPTTVLVEFADRSWSLDGILDKVSQVKSSPSPTSFKSVALLLRRCEVGVTISEVDRAVLTSTSLSGAKGQPLRDFFTRLADICLDRQVSSGRIDILNYNSSDAAKLAKRLTDLIQVHVTVSGDLFGFDPLTQNKGECTAMGDDYFDRNRLADILYADLEPLIRRTPSRPRKDGDQVLYSDVAL